MLESYADGTKALQHVGLDNELLGVSVNILVMRELENSNAHALRKYGKCTIERLSLLPVRNTILYAYGNGGGVEERNNYHKSWFYLHLVGGWLHWVGCF